MLLKIIGVWGNALCYAFQEAVVTVHFLLVTVEESIILWVAAFMFKMACFLEINNKKLSLFSFYSISALGLSACLSVKQKYVHKARKVFLRISIPVCL